jgi:hypothetical protein
MSLMRIFVKEITALKRVLLSEAFIAALKHCATQKLNV